MEQSNTLRRGLEELRLAVTDVDDECADDDDELAPIRRHRGAIVLAVVGAAVLLCLAGVVSSATRRPPQNDSVLVYDAPAPAPADKGPAKTAVGPDESPTIAIAPPVTPVVSGESKKRTEPAAKAKHPRPRPQAAVLVFQRH